mmetsp:Transcript_92671/g.144561  ORF Transcript_92671/g.144561 Transcript_92671/m.144561 type:complete len:92 (-) Transcript_92671:744-1019(-)
MVLSVSASPVTFAAVGVGTGDVRDAFGLLGGRGGTLPLLSVGLLCSCALTELCDKGRLFSETLDGDDQASPDGRERSKDAALIVAALDSDC